MAAHPEPLNARRREFEDFVWDHAADAFQLSFDERRELTSEETQFLSHVHESVLDADDSVACQRLQLALQAHPDYFGLVLQIVGLTRSKIITDLRGSTVAASKGLRIPSNYSGIPSSQIWALAGPYLLKRLRIVLAHLTPSSNMPSVFQALNQSTWPGYVRQERAKRSGHEAEFRLATLFSSLKIPFVPEEKAENPLCRDAQIGGISFDIVVPDLRAPKIVFKATVHTANIGQYGESKDHLEIDEARRWLDTLPGAERPLLVALIDGVGFRSNSAGLNGVLLKSDEFCQFRTIWKAAILAARATRRALDVYLPADALKRHAGFIDRYRFSDHSHDKEGLGNVLGLIEAGEAFIRAS